MMTVNILLASALEYAARGWYVFPVHPGTAEPAVPRHRADRCDHSDPRCRYEHTGWEQRATTNPDRITRTWSRASWGIAIACGPSGLLVLSTAVDPATGQTGDGTLLDLARQHGALPSTWTVLTPVGGVHRYYSRPTHLAHPTRRLGPLATAYGAGSYVLAPPTRTPHGRYDQLLTASAAEPPDWLTHLLTPPEHTEQRT
jgi:hypothetical protein